MHFKKKVWDILLKKWIRLTCFGAMLSGSISLAERQLNGLTSVAGSLAIIRELFIILYISNIFY